MEMVSVYNDEKGKLAMTHYCAMGNQPHMKLESADEKSMNFMFDDQNTIDPAKDNHMHALKITWSENNHIRHDWACYQEGKQAVMAPFELTRVK